MDRSGRLRSLKPLGPLRSLGLLGPLGSLGSPESLWLLGFKSPRRPSLELCRSPITNRTAAAEGFLSSSFLAISMTRRRRSIKDPSAISRFER